MNTKPSPEHMKQKLNAAAAPKQAPIPPTPPHQNKKSDEALQKLAEEVAHWKDLAMRTAAEMENLKKRTQIDIEKANRYATGSFAKSLLPVADCLEQALAFAKSELDKEKAAGKPENPVMTNILKGVEMTAANLTDALHKQQIEKIPSLGQVFDPNFHKVIQEVEDKTKPAGTIVQELQPGYTIGGDRVLRDAMVIVTKQ